MPLLAAGWQPAKPGQHGTPEPGRSNHPLILCNIARSRRCTVSNASTTPKPLRRWLHRIGTHSRFSRQDTGYAQSHLLCKHSISVSPKFYMEACNPSMRFLQTAISSPSPMLKEDSRFQCRSGLFLNGQSLASQKKDSRKGIQPSTLGCPSMGASFFCAMGGTASWIPNGSQIRDLLIKRAILRPNKKRHSSATSRLFQGWVVQKPETRHTRAPYFGILQGLQRGFV